MTIGVLHRLMQVIEERKRELPERSYTTKLFRSGNSGISKKITEESQELVDSAAALDAAPDAPDKRAHLIYETGDLLYHLFVLLGYHDISLESVEDELARRFGTSGLDEKASREKPT